MQNKTTDIEILKFRAKYHPIYAAMYEHVKEPLKYVLWEYTCKTFKVLAYVICMLIAACASTFIGKFIPNTEFLSGCVFGMLITQWFWFD